MWGHGDLQATHPERGSSVKRPPKTVLISFTEAPSAGGRFQVVDGCGEQVLARVGGDGPDAELQVDGGQPGRWKVSYRVISSVDGHSTRGTFGFRVKGKKDCSEPPPASTGGKAVAPTAPAVPPERAPSGSFPLLPVVAGAALVIGAVAVRLLGSRS